MLAIRSLDFAHTSSRALIMVAGGVCVYYDESYALPKKLIVPYVITLLGRHRHLKVQFFYNNSTQTSFSAKKNHNLHEILKHRFGSDAIGLLAGGDAWYDEEEMIRAGVLAETGGRYHVLYDDSSPSYSEAAAAAPVSESQFYSSLCQQQSTDAQQVKRVHGFTYYESGPTITRSIQLKTSDGKVRPLCFVNNDTNHFDQLLHFLSVYGGDRYLGVRLNNEESLYVDDNLMFADGLEEGAVYAVVYKEPRKLNIIGRALEKRREVVYSTAAS